MQTPAIVQDTWVRAGWNNFMGLAGNPALEKGRFYYNHGWMRVEMSPVGPTHARDNHLIALIINTYAFSRGLQLSGYTNPSLRKLGVQEAQPDLAYYLAQSSLPEAGNSAIDLSKTAAPTLAVEVSATSLLGDDTGLKRKLYGQLGVQEYWVVDTATAQILLYGPSPAISDLEPIAASRVLPGLTAIVLAEALQRGRTEGDTAVMRYILDLSQS